MDERLERDQSIILDRPRSTKLCVAVNRDECSGNNDVRVDNVSRKCTAVCLPPPCNNCTVKDDFNFSLALYSVLLLCNNNFKTLRRRRRRRRRRRYERNSSKNRLEGTDMSVSLRQIWEEYAQKRKATKEGISIAVHFRVSNERREGRHSRE